MARPIPAGPTLMETLGVKGNKQAISEVRRDGWANGYTGIGTSRDKGQFTYYARDLRLLDNELSDLYYGDDLAATIIDAPVETAFRSGFHLGADDTELVEDFHKWTDDALDAEAVFTDCETWARLYGGSLLILGANDGQDIQLPLNEKGIKDVTYLVAVDRRMAVPETFYRNLGPKMGKVEKYRVQMNSGGGMVTTATVHESRCIRFEGVRIDRIKAWESFLGWGLSILQRPYPIIRDFGIAMGGTSNMLNDASQGVFKMKNLIAMMGSPQGKDLIARMQMVDMARSTARSILVDADTENFEKVATSFASIPETLDRYMQRVSAASGGIPVSILFGRSAAGMNATGDLDVASWNGRVESYRTRRLSPRMLRMYQVLSLAKDSPTKGKSIEGLTVEWESLTQPTQKEQAEAYNIRATADSAYITAGVLDPAAVSIARFGRGEYSATDAPKVNVTELEKELAVVEKFTTPDPSVDPATGVPTDPTKLPPTPGPGKPPSATGGAAGVK